MDVILSPITWQFSLVYLDDIITFLNAEKHIWHVRSVLRLLYKAVVTIYLKKCNFTTINIDYLGHVIWTGKLEPANRTADAIRDLKQLRDVPELKYSPDYALYTSSLSQILPTYMYRSIRTWKSVNLGLENLVIESHDTLANERNRLVSAPVLAVSRSEVHFTMTWTRAINKLAVFGCKNNQPDRKSSSNVYQRW